MGNGSSSRVEEGDKLLKSTPPPSSSLSRRSSNFSRGHRSGPLSTLNLNKYLNNGQQTSNNHLVDETVTLTHVASTTIASTNESEDSRSEKEIDDLENLLFGNVDSSKSITTAAQLTPDDDSSQEHHDIIKQSLDFEAACTNLIGDRSKAHILPVIPSAKHSDLHCIAPETVATTIYTRVRIR